MKNFLILPVILLGFIGCSNSNEPFTEQENEEILLPYFKGNSVLSENLPYYTENLAVVSNIKSLSDDYPLEIITEGGAKSEKSNAVSFYANDYEEIMKYCKIKLNKSDVINEATFSQKVFGFADDSWRISNKSVLDKMDKCANNYLSTKPIKKDELSYFLADDRIKNNLHYSFLKDSITKSTKDNIITYIEIFDIYRNLDKAIEKNLSTNLDKLNAELQNKDGETK